MESDELTAILDAVRERVRASHPNGSASALPLPDLMPLLHARDAAEAKVAAIGTVNPRAGGPLNQLIQAIKRTIARALDWHIREQVEFNRNVMVCVQAALEALDETRRALVALESADAAIRSDVRSTVAELQTALAELRTEIRTEVRKLDEPLQEMRDIRAHWAEWRQGWEHKLVVNETKLLRGLAELNAAFQHRTGQNEAFIRDQIKLQHADYEAALDRYGVEIQKRLWADLERVRKDYDHLIHSELRLIRQRMVSAPAPPAAPTAPAPQTAPVQPAFDYTRFAERFRGSEEYVKQGQQFYLPYFAGRREVLDIGCGRGEFLELMRDAGVPAHGIDLSQESIELCRQKGLEAETADLFAYLAVQPEGALDGIFCSQVVEHLPPERLPEMIKLAAACLQRDGVLAIETPNPECLAIFASHFYLDPTHARPVPHALLAFYMEEFGLGGIEVHPLSPAVESMPALASLPADFREAFFGGLDYAIIGRRL
ncbi:MAG TPA: methyltransferase domain-containing protein [Bryobacteraceae bacterium]|nr:methyltransferase domain-containing protein [Bryobacteraceae bacterium]